MSLNRTRMTIGVVGISVAALLFLAGCKRFSTGQAAAAANAKPIVSRAAQVSAAGVDAAEPVTASALDGSIYVTWVNHDIKNQADVTIARFTGEGEMQGAAVRINRQPGIATAWRGDPPSLAVASDGSVYVVWTARIESAGKAGTDLYLSVSHDRGQTFATQVKINDDSIPGAHGMHSLAVTGDGRIHVVWLDERNIHAHKSSSKAEGHHMESNREVFVANSTDGGRTFSRNRKLASDACPCCKTALAVSPDGTLYVGWRQVLPGNFRHIAVATSADAGTSFSAPVIVSDDHWVLQGCPVSGPSLSVDNAGNLRVLWYSAAEANTPGLYFSESLDKGKSFSSRHLLAQEGVRGTPVLTSGNDTAIAIWQSSGAAETKIRELARDGATFSVAANGELPSGAFANDKLFVTYIATVNQKRSVWLVKVG